MRFLAIVFFLFSSAAVFAQNSATFRAVVLTEDGKAVEFVQAVSEDGKTQALSDSVGRIVMKVPPKKLRIVFSHIGFLKKEKRYDFSTGDITDKIIMAYDDKTLGTVTVKGRRHHENASAIKLSGLEARNIPAPFSDFSAILGTLPGVVANNELSSSYSVRGGSFDENLVSVNGIPVYRPFLVRSGQQEGLSFVNPDMVDKVDFYSGGWGAEYGGKMSSNLLVAYREPDSLSASGEASLLGGSAAVGVRPWRNFSLVSGVRYKQSSYLLGTMETEGEYKPAFLDWQTFGTLILGEKTKLRFLTSYASNKYLVEPENRVTQFGTLDRIREFKVYFDGKEEMFYRTFQSGINLEHNFNSSFSGSFIASFVKAIERERYDIESAYWLSDITDKANGGSGEAEVIGVGTDYTHGRNRLNAEVLTLENKYRLEWGVAHVLKFGFGTNLRRVEDSVDEYRFIEDDGYAKVTHSVRAENDLRATELFAFVEDDWTLNDEISLSIGFRAVYSDVNGQTGFGPRAKVEYAPTGSPWVWRLSGGRYFQPLFYRETRRPDGTVNKDVDTPNAWHGILTADRDLSIWERPFKLSSSVYFKYSPDIVPFDLDDVRVRYYPDLEGKAYAYGLDVRISGEFVKGDESWFSLGLLSAKEKVGSATEYARRPTDQRLTLAMLFQDHIPNNPSLKVFVKGVYGTGLPLLAPGQEKGLPVGSGDDYKRLDVGFFKYLDLTLGSMPGKMAVGLEVLNMLGVRNTHSYLWVSDIQGGQYAVPNTLSQRFYNLKLRVEF
ncbi:TonB-dependent receptor [Fulvitalea axinellae]|uniref:TonB-dependent receptor n=1 Tax=Fulvitalea axinellae TaxID=1182444 RepID=A0AAU9CAR8_9BACT|nr:TonB-dependent receptor [Fulvitalea axinellae]